MTDRPMASSRCSRRPTPAKHVASHVARSRRESLGAVETAWKSAAAAATGLKPGSESRPDELNRYYNRLRSGWGTWIRTKIDGVRVRCSTVELSPIASPWRAGALGRLAARAAYDAPGQSEGASNRTGSPWQGPDCLCVDHRQSRHRREAGPVGRSRTEGRFSKPSLIPVCGEPDRPSSRA